MFDPRATGRSPDCDSHAPAVLPPVISVSRMAAVAGGGVPPRPRAHSIAGNIRRSGAAPGM